VGELVEDGVGERVQRALVAAAGVEDVELATIFGGDHNFSGSETGQGRGHLPDAGDRATTALADVDVVGAVNGPAPPIAGAGGHGWATVADTTPAVHPVIACTRKRVDDAIRRHDAHTMAIGSLGNVQSALPIDGQGRGTAELCLRGRATVPI